MLWTSSVGATLVLLTFLEGGETGRAALPGTVHDFYTSSKACIAEGKLEKKTALS